MDHDTPSVMRAVIVQEDRTVAVEERPIPVLEENEILVKVEAVALNPADWKTLIFIPDSPGTILGYDFSGTVVRVAAGCKASVAEGDHVAGFVHGGNSKDRGAFADYLKADSDLVWVVPRDMISHEGAATMACALYTAVQALSHLIDLKFAEPWPRKKSETWIFIYSGSTSVGQFAIQLAHLAGYKVATVASPRSHALLRSLGADIVHDYKSSDFISEIKRAASDEIHVALDAFSGNKSELLCIDVLGPGSGKVVVLNPPDEHARNMRADVEVEFTVVFTVLGLPFVFIGAHIPAFPQERAHIAEFLRKLPVLVEDGHIKPNKVKLWRGGLKSVTDGLIYMMENKVGGEKVVYRV